MKSQIEDLTGALSRAAERLSSHVASPRSDAEMLLMHVLRCSRTDLYAGSVELDESSALRFFALIDNRRAGYPLQHLTGLQTFRGLELQVGAGVLIPRQETELLVDHALNLLRGVKRPMVVDVGTGSGAVALALASELPDANVVGVDNSPRALEWARRNRSRLGTRNVAFFESDLLSDLPPLKIDLLVSNPPYLTEEEIEAAPVDVRLHEPRVALFGGRTGSELSLRLIDQSEQKLRRGAWIVLENSPSTMPALADAMSLGFEEIMWATDLTGRDRFIWGRKR